MPRWPSAPHPEAGPVRRSRSPGAGERGHAVTAASTPLRPLHPLHAIFLAFPLPLFLGALLADLAYAASFQVQWVNFASWLIAGGLLVSACALLWALLGLYRGVTARNGRPLVYVIVL